MALDGTLYGTTLFGGSSETGTIFALTPAGNESVLYSFAGLPNGALPFALMASGHHLFGTTSTDGTAASRYCQEDLGCGVLFRIAPSTGKTAILDRFAVGSDGSSPLGYEPSINVELGGTLYGTVAEGGAYGNGAIYLFRDGVEKIVYSFKGGKDEQFPNSLISIGKTLYGTTERFSPNPACTDDCRTIFSLTTGGIKTILHSFTGGDDGSSPDMLLNGGGELYATVRDGGTFGFGKIAKLKGGKMETVYAFKGGNDGATPSSLIKIGDTLYGTTRAGGASSDGTLFAVTKDGQETVLHTFSGDDGAEPVRLIAVGGTLYGVTVVGGSAGNGTVFSYTP